MCESYIIWSEVCFSTQTPLLHTKKHQYLVFLLCSDVLKHIHNALYIHEKQVRSVIVERKKWTIFKQQFLCFPFSISRSNAFPLFFGHCGRGLLVGGPLSELKSPLWHAHRSESCLKHSGLREDTISSYLRPWYYPSRESVQKWQWDIGPNMYWLDAKLEDSLHIYDILLSDYDTTWWSKNKLSEGALINVMITTLLYLFFIIIIF